MAHLVQQETLVHPVQQEIKVNLDVRASLDHQDLKAQEAPREIKGKMDL